MTRVTAPGLPPFPKLYYDPQKCRAKVTARHSTWRSVEQAAAVTALVNVAIRLGMAYGLWVGSQHLSQAVVIAIMVLIVSPPIGSCLRSSLQPFLARRVFPIRTTLWVTDRAIAVRSHLYAAPVLVWRHWNNLPIGVRFIVDRDERAAHYGQSLSYTKRQTKRHLDSASHLVMVMTTQGQEIQAATSGEGGSCRAIPLTDLTRQDGDKFTMVYAMALSLTASGPQPAAKHPTHGVDIEEPTR